ncbi:hypothetical protein [Marinobacter caseinilyticus]|uniref:hypothetical protein n=1 Tax=Marinobacter caseinilyticus TaxID=2692195 RepID=UPI00140900DA|nr:hypothetical protein [Marinobacter caseinilyticus]
MKYFYAIIATLLLTVTLTVLGASLYKPDVDLSLTDQQLSWIADKIFQNECSGELDCLVSWGEDEDYLSLGIGHFKWYPKDVEGSFAESFPDLIKFMKSESVEMPVWLAEMEPLNAPWPDRETFLAQSKEPQVEFLRWLLDYSQHVQAQFMYERAQETLEAILKVTPEPQQVAMKQDIDALTSTLGGIYALIDYVNFKGEGLSAKETYAGEGWGLRQVLERMGEIEDGAALDRFRSAAADVLIRRAENAPQGIEAKRWIAGWLNRVGTYQS